MSTQNQNYLVIPLAENCSENTLAQLSDEFDKLLSDNHIYFVFDLDKIDILNSRLISYLANIHARLAAVKKKMVFVNAKKEVHEILEFVGLSTVIEIFDEEKKFVKAVERGEI